MRNNNTFAELLKLEKQKGNVWDTRADVSNAGEILQWRSQAIILTRDLNGL